MTEGKMKRLMLKSKIHRAAITGTALDYEGSITIDEDAHKLKPKVVLVGRNNCLREE